MVKKGTIHFYKDQKHARSDPEAHYKNEAAISLKGVTVRVADEYNKKKHVLLFEQDTGIQFLFQAKDDNEMNLWIEKISSVLESDGQAASSRSQTMPAGPSGKKEDPKKKGGMFTMKKK